ncbi:MAG: AAA family ATPase [Candidatus Electrothrix sp. YB6]
MRIEDPRPRTIRVGYRIQLERCQSWDESCHIFDEESAFAVEMALATGRPLLIRGEPGSGKSQLARAAAQELNRCLLAETITAASEGRDLLWQYDPVARLSEAQAGAAESAIRRQRRLLARENEEMLSAAAENDTGPQNGVTRKKKVPRYKKKKPTHRKDRRFSSFARTATAEPLSRINFPERKEHILRPAQYVSPGLLWWAFDSISAYRQYTTCRYPFYTPGFLYEDTDEHDAAERGFVVLIDEIDKADSSLPNALLEVLGNGGFYVPMVDESVGTALARKKPLVIITTNEERELPPAFVRRCLVLHLRFDDEEYLRSWWQQQADRSPQLYPLDAFAREAALIRWLAERGEIHFQGIFTERVRERAALLLVRDRRAAQRIGAVRPGQAEFLDLLRALRDMPGPDSSGEALELYQLALLKKISRYALVKSAAE